MHGIAVVQLRRAQRHEDVFSLGAILHLPGLAICEDVSILQQLYEGRRLQDTLKKTDMVTMAISTCALVYTTEESTQWLTMWQLSRGS